jgi:hypothetical protein
MKRPLEKEMPIADLFIRLIEGIELAQERWMETKPGIKSVWLKVAKDDLEKLIAIAKSEESTHG